MTSTVRHKTTL